jgi:hypothetical protein
MSVMEFVLVAHSIITGLAIAEVLRGISELFRSSNTKISYRLVLLATWTLLLLLQLWWAVWHVGDREVWTFSEFLLFLLPVGILYIIARLCFPTELSDVDLDAYYERVAPKIWWLVAAVYASFAFLVAPFIFGGMRPVVFASQVAAAVLALVASRFRSRVFDVLVILLMFSQVLWRGFAYSIGQ